MQKGPRSGGLFANNRAAPEVACFYTATLAWNPTAVDSYMQITDRAKDVIKSGGEWISSIEIENVATSHPVIALAALVGISHPKWDERPILLCQLEPGASVSKEAVIAYLDGRIAKWWLPDDVLFVDAIPLGPTGKIDKRAIRAGLANYALPFAASTGL